MSSSTLRIETAQWALPLLKSTATYRGAKGGRASGKSYFFAESLVERSIIDSNLQWVCIREVQRSLKFSAKKLIEASILKLRVGHLFDVTATEIRRVGGTGVIIFEGMQDHTAESLKSLEGFDGAWVEEGQSLTPRSVEILLPTIRKPGSEIWFSWNPNQPKDAVEELFREHDDTTLVHVNYTDNPWCPPKIVELAEWQRKIDPEKYNHIWLGGYNTKSEALIFSGRYRVDEFTPAPDWDGPYQGMDFGFAEDPMAAIRCWIHDRELFIEYDAGGTQIELDHTASAVGAIPAFRDYVTRADSARPDSISYLRRHGLAKIKGAAKGKGSVEDGIDHIKSYDDIVIHPRCESTIYEFGHYAYKIDRLSGDVLPIIIDKDNHWIDALRYALEPIMKKSGYDLMRAMA